jgi:hypothetical protein
MPLVPMLINKSRIAADREGINSTEEFRTKITMAAGNRVKAEYDAFMQAAQSQQSDKMEAAFSQLNQEMIGCATLAE